jgi:hypothetical protein
MPIPNKHKDEDSQKFVARCMGDEVMKKEYPDAKQRVAICLGQSQTKKSKNSLLNNVLTVLGFTHDFDCDDCGNSEELTISNLVIPKEEDYVDAGEVTEEYDISHIVASEYQGRKVTLNKPFRTPDGPKKSSVYVKNEKGNVVKVNFGDPNMEIKKDIPARRKSFRARMRCDNPGPKWKSRYWACKSW